jgi:hypothetical protein
MYGGNGCIDEPFLDSGTSRWPAARFADRRLYPPTERASSPNDTHRIKGWVSHRVDLGDNVGNILGFTGTRKLPEVFTAATMKNVVFWDIKTQFVLHRRHITSLLLSPAGQCYARFEVFTAATMKDTVFLDIKTQFVPHRRHITSPLESSRSMLCKI